MLKLEKLFIQMNNTGIKAFAKVAYNRHSYSRKETLVLREFMENQYKFTENKRSVRLLFPHAIKVGN
jgi:hypothetical protein